VPDTVRNDWQRAASYAAASQFVLLARSAGITAGIRRDEIDTQGVNYTRSARGAFEAGPVAGRRAGA